MLSVVIPAWNEGDNLRRLLPPLRETVESLGADWEILVADHEGTDGSPEICRREGARLLKVPQGGYGSALLAAFDGVRGDFVLTMDADLSHPSDFVKELWDRRASFDLVVASRYVEGGSADMSLLRRFLSRLLNWTFSTALQVPVKDLSSGFRLYRRSVLEEIQPRGRDFNILQEILIRAVALGFRVGEVPFAYRRRGSGESHARLVSFAVQYLRTFGRMWRLRNSIDSGDYDRRAYDSRIPMQRWWQRKRFRIITGWAGGRGPVLDVGCGSSRILEALPRGSVGIDPSLPSLRCAREYGSAVVAGGMPDLPVAAGKFRTLICSQVIEHIPRSEAMFGEFRRLLPPGGDLILGTPDYGRLVWRITEAVYRVVVPGGYADEHVTRYTRTELETLLARAGFRVLERAYVGAGELILRCRRLE